MCGIAGAFGWSANDESWKNALSAMGQTLVHRGPDEGSFWFNSKAEIGLSHRRLSIIDLSAHGHQPMKSSSGRWTLIFNGEIYNFKELRALLENEGAKFRGHSDTEVILELLDRSDFLNMLSQISGMFAIAAWNSESQTLYLARDRLGEKPLYYGYSKGVLLFASELKALNAFPEFTPEINDTVLMDYVALSYIPQPQSIYRSINKLLPGHFIKFSKNKSEPSQPYWEARSQFQKAKKDPFRGSIEDATHHVESLLERSVRRQLISDVPLGAFLSSGIDSSTIVAIAARSHSRLRTFTMAFDDPRFDESKLATEIAQKLGTSHETMTVTAKEALEIIPKIPSLYDEPFADSSQIAVALLSRLTRQYVKVALSGDGGDEVFGGYNRHQFAVKYWPALRRIPHMMRKSIAQHVLNTTPSKWESLAHKFFGAHLPVRLLGEQVHKFVRVASSASSEDAYDSLVTKYAGHPTHRTHIETDNLAEKWMLYDLESYLPNDCLTKVDRASMAASLETRAPYLDHTLIEFVFSLPPQFKVTPKSTKILLRRIAQKYIPQNILDAPKMGFAVPIGEWLRGPLRDWAHSSIFDLVQSKRLPIDSKYIDRIWQEHLSQRRNHSDLLWNLIVLQNWMSSAG